MISHPARQDATVNLQAFGVDPVTRVLTDLKTMNAWKRLSSYPDLPHEHHTAQVWIYGWLLEKAGLGKG